MDRYKRASERLVLSGSDPSQISRREHLRPFCYEIDRRAAALVVRGWCQPESERKIGKGPRNLMGPSLDRIVGRGRDPYLPHDVRVVPWWFNRLRNTSRCATDAEFIEKHRPNGTAWNLTNDEWRERYALIPSIILFCPPLVQQL